MKDDIRERYPYLYETHLHTSQGSACAKSTGAEMARACKAYGYTGIFVTDHNWAGNTAVDSTLPWRLWVKRFCEGYEDALAEGRRIGLDVFFGYEACYGGTEFLIYGVSKEWMLQTPQLQRATVEEQYRLVHAAGGLVMHAHPFREEFYIPEVRLYPDCVDGVEGINGAHHLYPKAGRDKSDFDEAAIAYARKHLFPMSAGSDIHSTALFGCGCAFKRRLRSGTDYVEAILQGEDYVMTDGRVWYDRDGNIISSFKFSQTEGRTGGA